MLRATDPRSHGPGGLGEGHGDAVVVPEHLGGTGGGQQEGIALGVPAGVVALAVAGGVGHGGDGHVGKVGP